jgi:arabinose-5-phosphate isomerase
MGNKDFISAGKRYIQIELDAINALMDQMDEHFNQAVRIIADCKGKVVFCGIGKSGHICNKLSSTFSSIGIPSIFLHPAESAHGDLGVLDKNDILICISYSGESDELVLPIRYAARNNIPMIALTGNLLSTLARNATVAVSTRIPKEACPYNLAPTASTTVSLVMGDALGLVAAIEKGYTEETFAKIHPAGSLGIRLTKVKDLMVPVSGFAIAAPSDQLKTVISKMTAQKIRGIAAIVDSNQHLIGALTDGDLRRFFERDQLDFHQSVDNLMNDSPKTILPNELVENALAKMEQFNIQSLFVCDESGKILGAIHIQNILKDKTK